MTQKLLEELEIENTLSQRFLYLIKFVVFDHHILNLNFIITHFKGLHNNITVNYFFKKLQYMDCDLMVKQFIVHLNLYLAKMAIPTPQPLYNFA